MSDSILIEEYRVAGGQILAHARLNAEATLNSLSLEMTRALYAALLKWQQQEDVVGVVITGSGDKALCAGGDIQALYHAIRANQAAGQIVDEYPFSFFAEEYRLDYLLHTYSKPVVCIGHGIVMGGGLGIFCAAKYRVLTEKSRLAVPEITIGLFPDAGATHTLGKMQPHHAAFLGLTGSHVNATDSLVCAMGDYVVSHDARDGLLQAFKDLPWQADPAGNDDILAQFLDNLPNTPLAPDGLPASELAGLPERTINTRDLAAEVDAIYALAGTSQWIDRGIKNLQGGCPTTAGIVLEQLRRIPHMSLADSFRMELVVATHCALKPDFAEGVRALLIEKDNKPNWLFGDIEHLDSAHVLSHFEPPRELIVSRDSPLAAWPDNPLADLGQ